MERAHEEQHLRKKQKKISGGVSEIISGENHEYSQIYRTLDLLLTSLTINWPHNGAYQWKGHMKSNIWEKNKKILRRRFWDNLRWKPRIFSNISYPRLASDKTHYIFFNKSRVTDSDWLACCSPFSMIALSFLPHVHSNYFANVMTPVILIFSMTAISLFSFTCAQQ